MNRASTCPSENTTRGSGESCRDERRSSRERCGIGCVRDLLASQSLSGGSDDGKESWTFFTVGAPNPRVDKQMPYAGDHFCE